MPYFEPSRPTPDCLTPPNGATSFEMIPVLTPTMPYSSDSAIRNTRPDVARVEVRGEPELGGVRRVDRFLVGREPEHRRDRAERFLACHQHLARDIRQHGRLVERSPQRVTLPAGHDPGALGLRVGHVRLDLRERVGVDQRALLHAPLEARADLQLRRLFGEALDEGVVDLRVRVEAVGADTRLAGVAVLGEERTFDGRVEVGIVEHDERRVATEFERQLLQRRRALLHQDASDRGRSGEGQLANHRRIAQRLADGDRVLLVRRDDVEHARREPGALREFGEGERRQRCLLGGLDDDRAAGRERRRHLARDHRVREVPRRDRGGDADRLLQHQQPPVVGDCRDGVAVDPLGLFGEPLDERRPVGHFAAALGERLALLGGHQFRQVVLAGEDQLEPLPQHGRAFLRRLAAPRRHRVLCGRDRSRRFRRPRICDFRELESVGRVVDDEACAGLRGHPGSVDERIGLQQRSVRKRRQSYLLQHGTSRRQLQSRIPLRLGTLEPKTLSRLGMKFDQLPSDLRTWFRDMISRRTSRDDLLRALVAAGYQKRMAQDAVAAAVAAIPAASARARSGTRTNDRARGFGVDAAGRFGRGPAVLQPAAGPDAQRIRDVGPAGFDAVRACGAAGDPVRQSARAGRVRSTDRAVARQAGAVERGERSHRQLRRASPSHERRHALRAGRERTHSTHRGAHLRTRADPAWNAASRCRSCTTSRAASTSRTSTTSTPRCQATKTC